MVRLVHYDNLRKHLKAPGKPVVRLNRLDRAKLDLVCCVKTNSKGAVTHVLNTLDGWWLPVSKDMWTVIGSMDVLVA